MSGTALVAGHWGTTGWGEPADFHQPVRQDAQRNDGGGNDGLGFIMEWLEEPLVFRGVEIRQE